MVVDFQWPLAELVLPVERELIDVKRVKAQIIIESGRHFYGNILGWSTVKL